MNNTLDSLAPHGATHYEVEQKGAQRRAGYMRLNQEGVWDFWSIHEERWIEDKKVFYGYVETNKFIKLHVAPAILQTFEIR